MLKKLKHVLHNALHSWVGVLPYYEKDSRILKEGKYSLREIPGLYSKIIEFGKEEGLGKVKGSVIVRDVCICKGRRHYRGREYLIKVASGIEVAFGFVRVVRWKEDKMATVEVV